MKRTDFKAFWQILISIGMIYDKEISKMLAEIYFRILKECELEELRLAFRTHVHNPDGGQYFPRPADLVRLVDGSAESRALQAWTKVQLAIGQVGRYHSVVFDDPLIHAVIEDMGGWISLCAIDLKALPYVSLEFQKRYRAFVSKPPHRHPSHLIGIEERDNAKNGYPYLPPVFLGDLADAKEVMASGGGQALLTHRPEQSLDDLIQKIAHVQKQSEKHE